MNKEPGTEKQFTEVEHELLGGVYTKVFHETEFTSHAPHYFKVERTEGEGNNVVGAVHFQEGTVKEAGVNGVFNEDLIAMILTRLQFFQGTQFACRENAMAITKLEEALMWLNKRTTDRRNRGVEGTYKK